MWFASRFHGATSNRDITRGENLFLGEIIIKFPRDRPQNLYIVRRKFVVVAKTFATVPKCLTCYTAHASVNYSRTGVLLCQLLKPPRPKTAHQPHFLPKHRVVKTHWLVWPLHLFPQSVRGNPHVTPPLVHVLSDFLTLV